MNVWTRASVRNCSPGLALVPALVSTQAPSTSGPKARTRIFARLAGAAKDLVGRLTLDEKSPS